MRIDAAKVVVVAEELAMGPLVSLPRELQLTILHNLSLVDLARIESIAPFMQRLTKHVMRSVRRLSLDLPNYRSWLRELTPFEQEKPSFLPHFTCIANDDGRHAGFRTCATDAAMVYYSKRLIILDHLSVVSNGTRLSGVGIAALLNAHVIVGHIELENCVYIDDVSVLMFSMSTGLHFFCNN